MGAQDFSQDQPADSDEKTREDAAASYDCAECDGKGEVDGEGCLNCGGTGKATSEFS
jgi:DnaJ-class molecular chaperone